MDTKYKCNICEANITTDEKCLDLLNHITSDHKEVSDLHKDNPDGSIGFQIEFLHMNMLKDEEVKVESNSAAQEVSHVTVLDEDTLKSGDAKDEVENFLRPKRKKSRRTYSSLQFTRKRSWVWKYFDKLSSIIYRCNMCNVVLSIKGCNTNNMNRHVRTRHPIVYMNEVEKKVKDFTDIEEVNETATQTILVLEGTEKNMTLDETSGALTPQQPRRSRHSWVWSYFRRVSAKLAQCRLCGGTICHGGNATGNMNRHLKLLHHTTNDTSWVWKVFEHPQDDIYTCKICQFQCPRSDDVAKNVESILDHLKTEHGVVSGRQIITGSEVEGN